MKLKRILSALVAAATAFSMVGGQMVFAAGETYIKNVGVSVDLQENITANIRPDGVTATGAYGTLDVKEESSPELAGDKYLQYNIDASQTGEKNLLWFKLDDDYPAPIYIEFDCKFTNMRRNLILTSNFVKNPYNHRFFTLSPKGKITLGDPNIKSADNTVATADIPVKSDAWYHISIGLTDSNAVCYVDGEKAIDMEWKKGGLTSRNSSGGYTEYFNVRSTDIAAGAETLCLDNLKVYQSEKGFDDAFAGNAAYIASASDGIKVDNTALRLELTDALDADAILNAVTLANGATAVYDEENGTLTVTSQNKKISRVYTVNVPTLSSSVYKLDYNNYTISPIYKYTTVTDFLASFVVKSGSVKLMKGETEVTDGYVAEGMTLRHLEDPEDPDFYTDYKLVFDNGIVDVNFDNISSLGETNWKEGFGTYLGQANPGNSAGLSIVNDAEKGSNVLKYSGQTGVTFSHDNQFKNYKSFNYDGYNFEISFKALDDNAFIKLVSKSGENGGGDFGIDAQIQKGGNIHWYYSGANSQRATAEINKWHNVVYSVMAAKDAEGKSRCTIYLDGKKVGEYDCNNKPENVAFIRMEFVPQDKTKTTTMLIDDVKFYPITKTRTTEYFDDRYVAVSASEESTGILSVSGDKIVLTSDNMPISEVGGAIAANENVNDMIFVNKDGSIVEDEEFDVSEGMKLIVRNSAKDSLRVYDITVASEPALAVYNASGELLTDTFTGGVLYAKAGSAALSDNKLLVLASYNGDVMTACNISTVSAESNSSLEFTPSDDATSVKAFLITSGTLAPAANAITLTK